MELKKLNHSTVPLVSIIVPNYNHARYLPQRIESILNQTIQDFELILLDDCSTDGSQEILKQYANHPAVSHLIFNTENTGNPFYQWTKGIELARGKYVWIAESDDWCESQLLETLVPALERAPDCMVSFCQSFCINNTGEILWQSSFNKLEAYLNGPYFIARYLTEGNSIFNASMAIFRRKRYYEISKEFTHYKFCGDWMFWIQLLENGNVFVSAKLLNFFRKHAQDVSGKSYATGINWIEQASILDYLHNHALINNQQFRHGLCSNYSRYWHKQANFSTQTRQEIEKKYKDIGRRTGIRLLLTEVAVRAIVRRTINKLKGIASNI